MAQKGLTSSEVRQLTEDGKINRVPDKASRSVPSIFFHQIFTYFNAIFAFLAILLIITGSFRSLTFLPVVIANTLIGIFQQLRSKKVLDELALLDMSEYTAIRDGSEVKVAADKLVLGDVIKLAIGQQIPADAVVLEGEAGVNESLLTGESDEVEKKPGSELKSGSFLTAGSIIARLTHVGAESYAAQLTARAKEVKDKKSEMIRDIEAIIKTAGILIIPIGGILLYQSMAVNGNSFNDSVVSMVGAVIGMIPEGMYLLLTMALALSAMRLAKSKVLLHDMRSIETLARVDVLCLDKTGTITSEDMPVSELFPPYDITVGYSEEARNLLASYIHTMPDSNITMEALRAYLPEGGRLEDAKITPFNSKKKYSRIESPRGVFRLGAPEYILPPREYEENRPLIEARAEEGKRVLVFAEDEGEKTNAILFVALHNAIRENAVETFKGFADQGVVVKVISGDNPLTVSRVAAQAQIAGAENYVDATTLDTPEKIKEAALNCTVFGRVGPEQKKDLVLAMKEKGLKVAMSGDGVNDILAMKEADCSVAMGGGSDAARQAAQVVLLDSDFSHMREIVGEGRRDINNITRSATLFLYKNMFSLLMALFSILLALTYPLRPAQVSLVSAFNIGIPAFLLALEPNEKKQQGRFIRNTLIRSIPAALTSFLSIALFVRLAPDWGIPEAEIGTACTYLLSLVGFLILLHISRPLNRYRLGVIALSFLGFVVCAMQFNELFEMLRVTGHTALICLAFAGAEVLIMMGLTAMLERIGKQKK